MMAFVLLKLQDRQYIKFDNILVVNSFFLIEVKNLVCAPAKTQH